MEDEADFLKAGDAKAQKDAFISETGELMKVADVDDKALAKQKRADKKYKRKMKEREVNELKRMAGCPELTWHLLFLICIGPWNGGWRG